jgi:serine-type D-Ala-D-Ala carboxypeptidase (penicillin-binding protein 5/6)
MKRFFLYCISSVGLAALFFVSFLFLTKQSLPQNRSFIAPLPNFLLINQNKQVTLLDFWLPFLGEAQGSGSELSNLTATSIVMYDLSTNKVLYEKNAHKQLPMASLTKIMTAIVSLENKRANDRYTVQRSNLVGEDSMGLIEGEVLTLDELLYGLLLPSGNDAAEVLASNSPFGREGFIQAMNDKAKALGLVDTQFSNPSGLQGDGVQHTTAYDLLVITRYALEHFPRLSEISSQSEYDLPATSTHQAYHLVNETNLLTTYEGVKGFKTGYTPEAGLCLVTYYENHGHKIIGIILHSENRRIEMKELLDYSLKSLDIEPPEYKE